MRRLDGEDGHGLESISRLVEVSLFRSIVTTSLAENSCMPRTEWWYGWRLSVKPRLFRLFFCIVCFSDMS